MKKEKRKRKEKVDVKIKVIAIAEEAKDKDNQRCFLVGMLFLEDVTVICFLLFLLIILFVTVTIVAVICMNTILIKWIIFRKIVGLTALLVYYVHDSHKYICVYIYTHTHTRTLPLTHTPMYMMTGCIVGSRATVITICTSFVAPCLP